MKKNTHKTSINNVLRIVGLFVFLGLILGVSMQDAYAQVPPANTTIGNQASATYLDSANNPRTVTSNTVETIVQQVAGLTISAGVSKTVSPGGQVQFTHIITNTGNGVDSYALSVSDANLGNINFSSMVIYPDANLDGAPDNFTPITSTTNVAAGASFGVVIVASIPGSAIDSDTETINITATSNFNNTINASATDVVTVDEGAVIDVLKSFSTSTASAGDTIRVTFTFSNNGNANGTNLKILDPLPAGLTYIEGTALWSGLGTTLTGAKDGDEGGIDFFATSSPDSVNAIISQLNSGQSGTLSFDVQISPTAAGQTIANTGTFFHDDLTGGNNTNTATVTVGDNFNVTIVGPVDVVINSVNQGTTLEFLNEYQNTGTTTDRFNLSLSGSTYPAGTTFTLLRTDGAGNPLNAYTDTNGDGIPDTGPIAAGAVFQVILRANLPSSATGGPFEVIKRARSIGDPTKFDDHVDKLTSITPNAVDITNDAPASDAGTQIGEGIGPESAAVQTKATNPGQVVTFTLFVANTGPNSDNYSLSGSTDNTFGTISLPSGWSVVFKDPNNGNSVVANTGSIASGANKRFIAEVTVPAGFQPGAFSLFFRVRSSTSGAQDIIHNQVSVNEVRNISLVSNQSGQVFPGGSRNYLHALKVNSNVTENGAGPSNVSQLQIEVSNSIANGFTTSVYWDANSDGQIDAGDVLISNAGDGVVNLPAGIGALSFNQEVKFIVKVTANSGVSGGVTLTSTLTVSDANTANTGLASVFNDDITLVDSGLVLVQKSQSKTNGSGYVSTQLSALPGEDIFYQIIVTNTGASTVTNVEIIDTTPSFTTVSVAPTVTGSGSPVIAATPVVGQSGTIRITSASLAAGQSFTIRFGVQVSN